MNTDNMDPNQTKIKITVKDFFLNLGTVIVLSIVVGHLLNLLFTIINKAYPITTGYSYGYYGSYSISWPVATLIVVFPIYISLMWLLEKEFEKVPEKRFSGIHKWLTYMTLFIAGFIIPGDLITVLYYFIDGQEMTMGFIMKILSVLVVALAVFFYYISDIMGKLNSMSRKVWIGVSFLIILGAIVWGFSVLGSPRTQQLLKYDQQKVSDLQNINSQVISYYSIKGFLPKTLEEMVGEDYSIPQVDPQSQKPYEYERGNDATYKLCAEFNRASDDKNSTSSVAYPYSYDGMNTWAHPAGKHCFKQSINPNLYNSNIYPKSLPALPAR